MKASTIIFILLFFCLTGSLRAESTQPNKYELAIIEDNIRSSFDTLMQIWKEELYFEMYDFGQRETKKVLKKAEFVQRMVDLKWKPAVEKETLKKVHIIYRNFGSVHVVVNFQNKINATYTIKKEIVFPIILEKNTWKYDLTQIIRIPYIGKVPQKKQEKPAEPKDGIEVKKEDKAPVPPAAE